MDLRLTAETMIHLRPIQVVSQMVAKVSRHKLKEFATSEITNIPGIITPINKFNCYDGESFIFLNIPDTFHSWSQIEHGMLWAYNLNYMDWLGQNGISANECERWIDKFIEELPQNTIGLDPYPIALRSINWIKFFCNNPVSATKARLDSLYSQIKLLEKKLEFRLLGNHLLEDAYALFMASIYFKDIKLYIKSSKLLKSQLEEQILPDGAHFEQSAMYHCILLDRLLDCVNFSSTTDNKDFTNFLMQFAVKELGHLESIIWEDGSIPMFNDAANGIAPTADDLFDYAKRLGLLWFKTPTRECGYRKLVNSHMEAIIDIGNITASYQPGHTHADTFNYELRIDGMPFIVDTGVSTYDKTPRRQYERSTLAHNCAVVESKNSSHVWGGFRVGKRANVKLLKEDGRIIEASHDGYEKSCRRRFEMKSDIFIIEDFYDGVAVSYIHLAEGADENRITIEGAKKIEIENNRYSTEYNQFKICRVMKLTFCGHLKYTIK